MNPSRYQSIDPAVLLAAVGGDLPSFHEMSQTFLRIAPPMLAKLETAISLGDCAKIAQESHSLKGTTSLVGASKLTGLVQDIELRGKRGETGGFAAVLHEVTQEFSIVMEEVQASILDFQGPSQTGAPQ